MLKLKENMHESEIGCYTLHLYCIYQHEYKDEFDGATEFNTDSKAQARKHARREGWLRKPKGGWVCPTHVAELARAKP